jgi:transposase
MSNEIDWAAEVAAWRASGQTARQFCEEREYSTARLYWWSTRLKRTSSGAEGKKSVPLARVVRKPNVERARIKSAPIILHVGHARMEVSADTDRAALVVALEALAATDWDAQ